MREKIRVPVVRKEKTPRHPSEHIQQQRRLAQQRIKKIALLPSPGSRCALLPYSSFLYPSDFSLDLRPLIISLP